jgi:hypothetical protein
MNEAEEAGKFEGRKVREDLLHKFERMANPSSWF